MAGVHDVQHRLNVRLTGPGTAAEILLTVLVLVAVFFMVAKPFS